MWGRESEREGWVKMRWVEEKGEKKRHGKYRGSKGTGEILITGMCIRVWLKQTHWQTSGTEKEREREQEAERRIERGREDHTVPYIITLACTLCY